MIASVVNFNYLCTEIWILCIVTNDNHKYCYHSNISHKVCLLHEQEDYFCSCWSTFVLIVHGLNFVQCFMFPQVSPSYMGGQHSLKITWHLSSLCPSSPLTERTAGRHPTRNYTQDTEEVQRASLFDVELETGHVWVNPQLMEFESIIIVDFTFLLLCKLAAENWLWPWSQCWRWYIFEVMKGT